MKRLAANWMLILAILASLALHACRGATEQPQEEEADLAPQPNLLPPLELKEDTPDLLLTWVDERGDFHVVQKPSDVPKNGREQVRVVVTTRREGTGKLVYVADLRDRRPDGTYPVRTMTRAQWDEVGAARRKARLEALAPSARRQPAVAPSGAPAARPSASTGRVVAVIYGAEWCKPCHAAAKFLKQLGVTVVEKNIESDQRAQQQMVAKLRRAGLPPTSSIPVIDVGGKVLLGFNQRALAEAVATARRGKSP